MTDTLDRLAGPIEPSQLLAGTAVYTPGSGVIGIVKNIMITNNDPTMPAFLWGSVGTLTNKTYRFIPGLYVPPGKTLTIPVDLVVKNADGDVINMRQSSMDDYSNVLPASAVALIANTTDAASFVTASWTGKNQCPYIMTVVNTKASAPDAPNSFTDTHTGVTWTLLQTIKSSDDTTRLSQYSAVSTGTTNTTTTVGFAATQTGCFISIVECPGASSGATPFNALGTVQNALSSTTPPLYVPNSDFDCRMLVSMATANVATTHTALPGWTEIHDGNFATPNCTLAVAHAAFPASCYVPTWAAAATSGTIAGFVGIPSTIAGVPLKNLSVILNGIEVT